jgi:hypothetical protein
MTPKEKAKKLFNKMFETQPPMLGAYERAKGGTLIAIEEKIKLYNELNELGLLKPNSIGFELAEIKQEIEKL